MKVELYNQSVRNRQNSGNKATIDVYCWTNNWHNIWTQEIMLLTMIIEIFFLFLFALMVCSNSVHVRLKPYGAKMCETVCEPPTCEYEFSFQHLECTLSISRTTQDTEKHMMMLATPRSPTPTTQPTTPHQMTSSQGKGNISSNNRLV